MMPRNLLAAVARNFPGKMAYACGNTVRTWREMDDRAERLAGALRALGVRKGDTVALLARESIAVYEHFFACIKLGAIRVGLNWRYAPAELAHIIRDCSPAAVIVDASSVALLPSVAPTTAVIGCGEGHGLTLDYESLIAAADILCPHPELREQDVLMYSYTSGTTGKPKGVMLTHGGVGRMILQSVIARGLNPDDIWSTPSPSSWMTVLLNMLGLANGMSHVIVDGTFEIRRYMRDLARWRATAVMMVPTMIQRAIAEHATGSYDLSALRLLMYGSAPATPALIRDAWDTFGCEMVQSFGMTEGGWVTQLTAEDHRRAMRGEEGLLRSVGRPGVMFEVSIRDARGEPVPAGETGEIWLRSPTVMAGYLNLPAETAAAMRDGWLVTNDIGRMDSEGYLYLLDRKNFMIITGAVNVFPSGIEDVVCRHPAIEEAVVVGAPHPEWGEAVVCVARLKKGATAPTTAELTDFCSADLSRMECPKHLFVVDELPRTLNGKVQKQEVKDWVLAQAYQLPWVREAAVGQFR